MEYWVSSRSKVAVAENQDRRLLKKNSEARRASIVIVSVKRDREIQTSTNTNHEHER